MAFTNGARNRRCHKSNEINARIIISRIRYARLQVHRDATRMNTLSQSQRLSDIRQSRKVLKVQLSHHRMNAILMTNSSTNLEFSSAKMLISLPQNISIILLSKKCNLCKTTECIGLFLLYYLYALLFILLLNIAVINQSRQKRITIIGIDII